jgi:hypothetical protein
MGARLQAGEGGLLYMEGGRRFAFHTPGRTQNQLIIALHNPDHRSAARGDIDGKWAADNLACCAQHSGRGQKQKEQSFHMGSHQYIEAV